MADTLQRHNVPHRLITNSKWEHMFDGPTATPELKAVFDQVTGFLAEYTR